MTGLRALALGLEALLRSEGDNLVSLAAAAGLDPATDFRNADLSGLDLRGEDLRAFDLSNAHLLDTLIEGARFNSTVSAEQHDEAIPFGDGLPPGPPPRIAIVALGRRGIEVCRHVRSPDWRPASAGDGSVGPYVVTHHPDVGASGEAQAIYVAPLDLMPPLAPFDIVVVVADDDVMSAPTKLPGLTGPGIRLLIPALPRDRPSAVLSDGGRPGGLFHAVIDSSVARSPYWSGNPWRSLDRRIADIAIGAAMLVDKLPEIRRALSRLHDEGVTALMAFAFGHPVDDTNGHRAASAGIASETMGLGEDTHTPFQSASTASTFVFDSLWARQRPKNADQGLVELRHFDRADPRPFLESVGAAAAKRRGSGSQLQTVEVPDALKQRLQYPAHAAGLVRADGRPLAVIAETPDIELAQAADDLGWRIARYTDADFIADVMATSEPESSRRLPGELRLPSLKGRVRNRGLATRGVDPRDVIRLRGALLADVRRDSPELLTRARVFRAAFDVEPHSEPEYLLPINDLSDWLAATDDDSDGLRAHLRTERARKPKAPKRPADLRVAWLPLASDVRFVVADGPVPVRVDRLGNGEVPAQSLFIVDGDAAVPALLQSSVFAAWARTTTTRSTSWMQRFSVGNTFETFPLAAPFELRRGPAGAAHLELTRGADRLRALASAWLEHLPNPAEFHEPGTAASDAGQSDDTRRSLDAVILEAYGLPAVATDLDIMRRLLAWEG